MERVGSWNLVFVSTVRVLKVLLEVIVVFFIFTVFEVGYE